MISAEAITILEALAADPEQALDIDQVHALYFAVGVIRSLPAGALGVIDAIFNLGFPEPLSRWRL